jgi:membrane associated rhomboid family serine protease
MNATKSRPLPGSPAAGRSTPSSRHDDRRAGLEAVFGLVAVMWLVELINTLDGNVLDRDGIYARSIDHLWGILTAPFLHASFAHLISNTIPFLFMGLIIALGGLANVIMVTLIVIVLGGLGTWLIGPAGISTIGASGVVFGYATYLLARGVFDRSALELLTGLVVGAIWGGALLTSLVPHVGISWQGHLSGAVAGVVAAWLLRPAESRGPKGGRPAL